MGCIGTGYPSEYDKSKILQQHSYGIGNKIACP